MATPDIVISGGGPAGLLAAILLDNSFQKHTKNTSSCWTSQKPLITVYEKSPIREAWSARSYSINLKDRGKHALQAASSELWQRVQARATNRHAIVMEDYKGEQKRMPRNPPSIAISRPILVEVLEDYIQEFHQESIALVRGVGVERLVNPPSKTCHLNDKQQQPPLSVELTNGTILHPTHIVGADGKWSKIRSTTPLLQTQYQMKIEPTWGIHIMSPTVPSKWSLDATTVFQPQKHVPFYVIGSPLPPEVKVGDDGQIVGKQQQQCSISVVCYNELLDMYPNLAPKGSSQVEDELTMGGWEAAYSSGTSRAIQDNTTKGEEEGTEDNNQKQAAVALQAELIQLFQAELPVFLEAVGQKALLSARINRRTSWIKPLKPHWIDKDKKKDKDQTEKNPDEKKEGTQSQQQEGTQSQSQSQSHSQSQTSEKDSTTPTSTSTTNDDDDILQYTTPCGRITLIGDAAHAMTPAVGEGCNSALESAMALVQSLPLDKLDSNMDDVIGTLSQGFVKYGRERPQVTVPLQLLSSKYSKFVTVQDEKKVKEQMEKHNRQKEGVVVEVEEKEE